MGSEGEADGRINRVKRSERGGSSPVPYLTWISGTYPKSWEKSTCVPHKNT